VAVAFWLSEGATYRHFDYRFATANHTGKNGDFASGLTLESAAFCDRLRERRPSFAFVRGNQGGAALAVERDRQHVGTLRELDLGR
jgi:hypothetical protein